MQVVPSTLLALVLAVLLFARGPHRGLWLFFAATPFGAAAAFNLPALGGASIGVLDIAAVTLFGYLLLLPGAGQRLAGTLRPGQPGFWLILLFLFAAVSALFFPRLFEGRTMVFAISRSANADGIISIPLRPTTGNITQLFRMSLEVITFLALATLFRARPDPAPVVLALAVAAGLNAALGWLDVLTHAAGLEALLEPIRTANYSMLVDHRMGGLKRMIGGFPEASSFGAYTLGLFAFWLGYLVHGPRSRLGLVMFGLTTLALLRSTSSSAYVALAVFLAALIVLTLATGLRPVLRRRGVSLLVAGVLLLWLGLLAVLVSYMLVPAVEAFLDRALFKKLSTSSGVERMSWNAQALRNLLDTWLVGAGLGSVRASSWLAASLGSLGVVGTLLSLRFLWSLVATPRSTGAAGRDAVVRALRYACLALFLQALLTKSTPNLGIVFFAFAGLLTGLTRGATLHARAGHAVPSAPPPGGPRTPLRQL
jgi:hypothetical protein